MENLKVFLKTAVERFCERSLDITIVQDLVHITTAKDVGFLHNTGNWCPHLAFKC